MISEASNRHESCFRGCLHRTSMDFADTRRRVGAWRGFADSNHFECWSRSRRDSTDTCDDSTAAGFVLGGTFGICSRWSTPDFLLARCYASPFVGVIDKFLCKHAFARARGPGRSNGGSTPLDRAGAESPRAASNEEVHAPRQITSVKGAVVRAVDHRFDFPQGGEATCVKDLRRRQSLPKSPRADIVVGDNGP